MSRCIQIFRETLSVGVRRFLMSGFLRVAIAVLPLVIAGEPRAVEGVASIRLRGRGTQTCEDKLTNREMDITKTSKRFQKLYKRYLALPNGVRAEIINGKLRTQARPSTAHGVVVKELLYKLRYFENRRRGPDRWFITFEPNLWLQVANEDPDLVHPDVLGWKTETASRADLIKMVNIDVTPDWICEVLSPGNKSEDRTEKKAAYAKNGVPFLWLIDPEDQTLEGYKLENGIWLNIQNFSGPQTVSAQPFDAIGLSLRTLWQ
jgi:Uma2 family endonuclease